MNKPKVLVAAPVFYGMDYCFKDFIEHLKKIDYPSFDILIVDNSRTKDYYESIKNIEGIIVIYDDTREEKNMLRIISSRNLILSYAIKKNYDYLLMMDCDVMVPPRIISTLLSHKKEVVSGIYFNYFRCDGGVQLLPVAYKAVSEEEFTDIKTHAKLPSFVKTKEDLRQRVSKEDIEKGELVEAIIPSGGCTLLSKKAFSSGVHYRSLLMPSGTYSTDDIPFFKELHSKGFKLFCDPNLICKHAVEGKRDATGFHPAYK